MIWQKHGEFDERSADGKNPPPDMSSKLYLRFPGGCDYGWGVCGRYLSTELPALLPSQVLSDGDPLSTQSGLPGAVFGPLEGATLHPWFQCRGEKNIGYVFLEQELQPEAVLEAKKLDLILTGSTWCKERLDAAGITHTSVLIQGIDPKLFAPLPPRKDDGTFVLYSAGKFELRKGQDLVLKAFSILSKKYPDLRLLNVWENQWPQLLSTMNASPHIRMALHGPTWRDKISFLCKANDIDPTRVMTCPLVPQSRLPALIARTDLGVFPNRCEGGTNLALMEYMACGKPVIASFSSGHRDIIRPENSLPLRTMNPFPTYGTDGSISARWEEPSIDELVATIDHAYHHRDLLVPIARQAGEDMARLTWHHTAEQATKAIRPLL